MKKGTLCVFNDGSDLSPSLEVYAIGHDIEFGVGEDLQTASQDYIKNVKKELDAIQSLFDSLTNKSVSYVEVDYKGEEI
jgi:hypothetical protein